MRPLLKYLWTSLNYATTIVNYVGSVAFEVRQNTSGEPFIRFTFKNGTDDDAYQTYGFMGSESGEVPLSTFVSNLSVRSTISSLNIVNLIF